MTSLPEWMHPGSVPAAAVPVTAARRRNVARRTLTSLARVISDTLTDTATTERDGLLQRIDARAKVLGLIGLLVLATFIHTLPALGLLYACCIVLGLLSHLPRRRYTGVWLLVPLLSCLVMLPVTLNVLTPGHPVLTLWQGAETPVAVTDAGLFVVGRLVLRTAVCIALAVLLTATTRPHRLFHGFRALGMPQLFVMLLAMMERYLTVLLRAAEEIHLGKLSRSPLPGTRRQERSWAAAGIGSLFRRTQALSNTVYLAMLSRGYTGEVRLLDEPRW